MQQKNFILFIALTFLIFAGWSMLESYLWPPAKRRPAPTAKEQLPVDARLWGDLFLAGPAAAAIMPGVPGLGSACRLVAELQVAEPRTRAQVRVVLERQAPPKPPPREVQAVVRKPSAPRQEIPIGNDTTYQLRGVLTTRGGGVQSLTLNHFKAASPLGRPEDRPLELIWTDRLQPAFVLYHYASPDDDRPVDTLGNLEWTVQHKDVAADAAKQQVVFAADVPGQDVRILKTFSLAPGDYHLGLTIEIQRISNAREPLRFRYQLAGGHGLPIEGVWYTSIFRNALIGLVDAGGHVWRDLQDSNSIGTQSGGNQVLKGDKVIQYAGVAIQYFASAIVVSDDQEKKDFLAWARPTVEGEPNVQKPFLDDITVRVVSEPLNLKPDAQVVHKYLLYNGPVKVRFLRELGEHSVSPALVDRYENTLQLYSMQDYGNWGWWTDVIIFCTKVMHTTLGYIHKIISSYGLCIVVLTLLVRGMMFPISRKQAMTSIRMQALAPELKKLQEAHKNDRQALGMAQMELYRKHGVNPLGSCWILLLQMPIFLGLYFALQESIHFRLAPFLWIENLAAPDMLIYWGDKIPLIADPANLGGFFYLGPFFNLLPVVAVALMIVQQKVMTPPAMDEQQEMQQKMMKYMMIFFGLMFYKVAAGLCLYFIVSSGWGLTERKLLPKARPTTTPATTQAAPGKAGSRPSARAAKGSNGDGLFQKAREMWEEVLKQAKKK